MISSAMLMDAKLLLLQYTLREAPKKKGVSF